RRILDAALTCFNQNGYQNTSLADIAREAGVSKGLVHYHFESKENLALAVEQDVIDRLFRRVVETIRPLKPSLKHALWALDEVWGDVRAHRHMAPMAIDLAARSLTDADQKQRMSDLLDGVSNLLSTGAASVLGPLADGSPVAPDTLGDILLILFGGMAIGDALLEDEARMDRTWNAMRTMILQYVLQQPVTPEVPDAEPA
ncbi:MAG: TetR/AcrR family transcriptional regulator, partial [Candidatus Dadabacteria bacterium]